MGPDAAIEIIYRKELDEAADPAQRGSELREQYRQLFANPYVAARKGYLDDVIEPATTRSRIVKALEMLADKRETNPACKHSNIPL